jgi:uncharacterized membrane protein YedE/YeeE
MDWLTLERWSPYVVGAGIGVLSWLSFILLDKPIGCSTAFARTAGMIERLFTGERVREKPYYQQFAPKVDWEWMLVLGVVVGAFISANLSGMFGLRWIPEQWAQAFGDAPVPRVIVALVGGILMGFGARWAGGCTSGHGISGSLQLAVSGWIAAACFFAGGTATAMLIYRVLAG